MYPSTLSSFTDPQASDRLNNPSHSAIERAQNAGIEQLEAVVGTSSSIIGTVIGDLRNPASNGGGHIQTANKGGTGQTSYTKGDLLVATSSSVLSKLAVGGTDGYALVVDSAQVSGVKWGLPGGSPVVRTYETSSSIYTWVKPSLISYAVIEIQAPGGNGAQGSSGGAGGGAGGYTRKLVSGSDLPTAASVLVRSGGTSSLISYFGSVLSVRGGLNAGPTIAGGGGSVLLGGDLNIPGQSGQEDQSAGNSGGRGGDSFYGFGGTGGATSLSASSANDAGPAGGYGGGGGGSGSSNDGSPEGTPSSGTSGVIIITEY